MADPIRKFTFTKEQRIRSSRDFARIYDAKNRAGDNHLLVFGLANDFGWTRIGLSVSKKHGNAVKRARLKRLLREAFRLSQHDLPRGLDLVLIPRQNSGATLADYTHSLKKNAQRLHRRLCQSQSTSTESSSR